MGVLPLNSGSYNAEQGRGGMPMDDILQVNERLRGLIWGAPMLILLLGTGLYFTAVTGVFQVRYCMLWLRKTLFSCFTGAARRTSGGVSPFAAMCTALAATVGTGNIAHRVADILRAAFDVRVLCWNPRRTAAECAAWGYEQVATLPELFRRSDFVNVSITLCDATRDLINAPVFAAANPDLLLVNTSRGGIVNEHDLYIALTTGQIRAAASDVFVHEPPACDDPLIHLDNFIATFHIGGSTYESLERVSNRAVDYVFEYTGVPEQKEVIGS